MKEDDVQPDHWMIMSVGAGVLGGFSGYGNDLTWPTIMIDPAMEANARKKIQLKRIPKSVWDTQGYNGYKYVQNVFPNQTQSIELGKDHWQAHHNTRYSNYEDWWKPLEEGGGAVHNSLSGRIRMSSPTRTKMSRSKVSNSANVT